MCYFHDSPSDASNNKIKVHLIISIMAASTSNDKVIRNPGCEFDIQWLKKVTINTWSVHDSVKTIPGERRKLYGNYKAGWLLRAVSCMDLTTLCGDDTRSNVFRLCQKAITPIKPSVLEKLDFKRENFCTAAVCVYPARIGDVVYSLEGSAGENVVQIASVASGFPSGQFGIKSRLLEIEYALECGANEIDVAINRELVITGNWKGLYDELKQMREACGSALMKTILSTGELKTFKNIYKASLVAMMAGSDFLKTSTGKEVVNATLPTGFVMIRAIRDYYHKTSYKVGFKPAGGIRTCEDALNWMILVKRELGNEWLNKDYFRIGASSLLTEIEKTLFLMVYKRYPSEYEITPC